MEKIKANLISGQVSSNSTEASNLFATSRFGEKSGQKIIYSLFETLYLIQDKKLVLYDFREKELSEIEVLKKFSRLDKNFSYKYSAFKDLRKKGYIVKTALKFGAEFRIYEKGKKIEQAHSKWICFPVPENESHTWQDFTAKNRVAHSTKKNLLIAIVDDESDVSYFEVKWTKI
jgi:tRNA-intron endonuclease